jgi:tRNA threonylcarbamoyladenosine biosynthesis protein TsaE
MRKELELFSEEETFRQGELLGASLAPNTVIALDGDLGSGKTTFIKGLAKGALQIDPHTVSSPTFNYLNIYCGNGIELYHFDIYRLRHADDFFGMGFDEYFDCGGICCIEWPEKIAPFLPQGTVLIQLSYAGENKRRMLQTR